MKIKIGDKIYDSADEPIAILFNDEEKELITNCGDQHIFCSFNENCDTNEILKFIEVLKQK